MGQKAQLWWDLPAEDCFLLLKEIYEIPDEEFKASLDELVTTLDVKHVMNIQIRRLSLGERMKMELIAALLHRPKVVFLDEPTIGLDITAQKAVREFIKNYREKYKPIMILTSHYMEDIKQLCERIVIVKDGKIVYDGKLDVILEKYTKYKVINVQLSENQDTTSILKMADSELVLQEGAQLKFKVHRDKVGSALNEIFKSLQVQDVHVEEEDITDIIEKLIKR
jgi:ABC-2 type transport system ATP-binding protein